MKTIWKYDLEVDEDVQEMGMPTGARILSVALQNNKPVLWAEVETEDELEVRRFCICATSQTIELRPFHRRFIGTFQIVGSIGTLVGHVFELV